MQTPPENKEQFSLSYRKRWPRATAALDHVQSCVDRLREIEAAGVPNDARLAVAQQAFIAATRRYLAAERADEADRSTQARCRVKCPCGSWVDPYGSMDRCPDCKRKIP